MEDDGYGDELMEMQQTLWPLEALRSSDFSLDKIFDYKVGDQLTLQWCQGKITKFISEKQNTHVIVEVEWNDKCLRDGDPKVTREKLVCTKWNPAEQTAGSWREDLYHKILNIN